MKGSVFCRLAVLFIFLLFVSFPVACDIKGFGIHVGEGPKKKGGPPPHAPAHGYRAKYSYHYYPSAYVYYDTSRKVYFYLEGGAWKMSVSLPYYLKVKLGDHVTIEMDTDKPHTKFEEHKKKYPPGQLKKKKKSEKKK